MNGIGVPPLLQRLGVAGHAGTSEHHLAGNTAAHGLAATPVEQSQHAKRRFAHRRSPLLERRGLQLSFAADDSFVARLKATTPTNDPAFFTVQSIEARGVPFALQPDGVLLAVRDATCLLVHQRGHARPLLFFVDNGGVRVAEVEFVRHNVQPGRAAAAVDFVTGLDPTVATTDPWLLAAVRTVEGSDDSLGFAGASGVYARLHEPVRTAPRFDLQAFLDGNSPPTVAERAAALVAEPATAVAAAIRLAEHVAGDVFDALVAPAVDDVGWQTMVRTCVHRREQLAGARLVLSRTNDVAALDAVLARLDEAGDALSTRLGVLGFLRDDPWVLRASVIAPDAWWVTVALPFDDA